MDGSAGRVRGSRDTIPYPQQDRAAAQVCSHTESDVRRRAQDKMRWDPKGPALVLVLAGENRRKEPTPPWAHQKPRGRQGR